MAPGVDLDAVGQSHGGIEGRLGEVEAPEARVLGTLAGHHATHNAVEQGQSCTVQARPGRQIGEGNKAHVTRQSATQRGVVTASFGSGRPMQGGQRARRVIQRRREGDIQGRPGPGGGLLWLTRLPRPSACMHTPLRPQSFGASAGPWFPTAGPS